jgi:hypothetical protein
VTIATHCLPAGALAAHQLPVPNVPGSGSVQVPSSPKGIAVLLHGLQTAPVAAIGEPTNTGGVLPLSFGTWASDLLADDWVVLFPSYAEDGYDGAPPVGLYADVANDTGAGARYLDTTLLWADHLLAWRDANYAGLPVALFGMSEGGWHVLSILGSDRGPSFLGGVAHCPATVWSDASPQFTGTDFGTISTAGMDLGPHALDSVYGPVLLSYGTSDAAVGFGSSGLGAGSAGVDVTTFTGSGTLDVADGTQFVVGPRVQVETSTGTATLSFTGTTSTSLTGVSLVSGGGTLVAGSTVVQSNATAIIANAQAAGRSVVANPTTDNHELLAADVTTFMDYTTGTLDPLR